MKPQVTVTEGGKIVLEAEASKANATGTWFKDDLEILPQVDKKYNVSVKECSHTLTINEAALEDAGEFTLEVGEDSTTVLLVVEGLLFQLKRLHSCFSQLVRSPERNLMFTILMVKVMAKINSENCQRIFMILIAFILFRTNLLLK